MKQRAAALALVLALAACSKSEDPPGAGTAAAPGTAAATRKATYALPGVKVSLEVPTGWKEQVDPSGEPSFTIPGRDFGVGPTIVVIEPRGDDPAARLASAIGLQFVDTDLTTATREDLPGGRVWIAHTRGDGYVHARMFLPAPGDAGVVMCVAMFKPEHASHLAAHRALCDSVTLQ